MSERLPTEHWLETMRGALDGSQIKQRLFSGGLTITVQANESLLMDRNETLQNFGLDAEIITAITAGGKLFLILKPDNNGTDSVEEKYLLVDSASIPADGSEVENYLEIPWGGNGVTINRNNYTYKYDGRDKKDRKELYHMHMEADEAGALTVHNMRGQKEILIATKLPPRRSRADQDLSRTDIMTPLRGMPMGVGIEPVADNSADSRALEPVRPSQAVSEDTLSGMPVAQEADWNGTIVRFGVAEEKVYGQDKHLLTKGVAGVFDGVAKTGGSAALEASRSVKVAHLDRYVIEGSGGVQEAKELLRQTMEKVRTDVIDNANRNSTTTATVAWFTKLQNSDGLVKPYLVWSSVGDSRIYLYREGLVEQLSVDEGRREFLYNSLGRFFDKDNDKIIEGSVNQVGAEELQPGDYIILVTDGVTGDKDEELMDEVEIANILRRSGSSDPYVMADGLVGSSRKNDDKTCVIVQIA